MLAQADYQRRVAAGGQNHVWLVLVNHQNRESAVQTVDHFGECGNQFAGALERLRNQVRGNLRIGFAGKFGAGSKQFGLEFGKIFDDAVVNQRQPGCLAAEVRVCIAVGGCAVGCPTGVANADVGGRQWV